MACFAAESTMHAGFHIGFDCLGDFPGGCIGKDILGVYIDGSQIATFQTFSVDLSWRRFTTSFVATSNTHELKFVGQVDFDGDPIIDNIEIKGELHEEVIY